MVSDDDPDEHSASITQAGGQEDGRNYGESWRCLVLVNSTTAIVLQSEALYVPTVEEDKRLHHSEPCTTSVAPSNSKMVLLTCTAHLVLAPPTNGCYGD